jgi:hypothetical protein
MKMIGKILVTIVGTLVTVGIMWNFAFPNFDPHYLILLLPSLADSQWDHLLLDLWLR